MSENSYLEQLEQQIRELNIENIDFNKKTDPSSRVIDEQKVYIWIRLSLKDEVDDLVVGDEIEISYFDEKLSTIFITYDKKNLTKDHDVDITNYITEDNKKVLCLMLDETMLRKKYSELPFLRTLFKTSRYYTEQVYRRSDLKFINKRNNNNLIYIDVEF